MEKYTPNTALTLEFFKWPIAVPGTEQTRVYHVRNADGSKTVNWNTINVIFCRAIGELAQGVPPVTEKVPTSSDGAGVTNRLRKIGDVVGALEV